MSTSDDENSIWLEDYLQPVDWSKQSPLEQVTERVYRAYLAASDAASKLLADPPSVGEAFSVPMLPEPKPKHDGILNGRNPYKVQHIFSRTMPEIASVLIGHEEGGTNDEVWLSPQQALSLLAWLEQERAILEQVAHIQETSEKG